MRGERDASSSRWSKHATLCLQVKPREEEAEEEEEEEEEEAEEDDEEPERQKGKQQKQSRQHLVLFGPTHKQKPKGTVGGEHFITHKLTDQNPEPRRTFLKTTEPETQTTSQGPEENSGRHYVLFTAENHRARRAS